MTRDDPRPTPSEPLAGFTHRFIPAGSGGPDPGFALLLLHGTGGDENDLLQLGTMLAPGAALLSPRGRVLESGMPRFFRRLREGVFDVPDLKARAAELAAFLAEARTTYSLAGRPLVAVGFSNGANIAGGLLFAHPGALDGAALLRPMVPYEPEAPPRLPGVPVLIAAGDSDPYGGLEEIRRLEAMLAAAGARVTVHRERAGHNLTQGDVTAAREWLKQEFGSGSGKR
ncbi:MAG TPA: alpha/beta hydrolase [Candidatus Eisenbacteria bacterium]|nr:alpha/beta hydrolase [Candidatus Eisenbacteria bacterium]